MHDPEVQAPVEKKTSESKEAPLRKIELSKRYDAYQSSYEIKAVQQAELSELDRQRLVDATKTLPEKVKPDLEKVKDQKETPYVATVIEAKPEPGAPEPTGERVAVIYMQGAGSSASGTVEIACAMAQSAQEQIKDHPVSVITLGSPFSAETGGKNVPIDPALRATQEAYLVYRLLKEQGAKKAVLVGKSFSGVDSTYVLKLVEALMAQDEAQGDKNITQFDGLIHMQAGGQYDESRIQFALGYLKEGNSQRKTRDFFPTQLDIDDAKKELDDAEANKEQDPQKYENAQANFDEIRGRTARNVGIFPPDVGLSFFGQLTEFDHDLGNAIGDEAKTKLILKQRTEYILDQVKQNVKSATTTFDLETDQEEALKVFPENARDGIREKLADFEAKMDEVPDNPKAVQKVIRERLKYLSTQLSNVVQGRELVGGMPLEANLKAMLYGVATRPQLIRETPEELRQTINCDVMSLSASDDGYFRASRVAEKIAAAVFKRAKDKKETAFQKVKKIVTKRNATEAERDAAVDAAWQVIGQSNEALGAAYPNASRSGMSVIEGSHATYADNLKKVPVAIMYAVSKILDKQSSLSFDLT